MKNVGKLFFMMVSRTMAFSFLSDEEHHPRGDIQVINRAYRLMDSSTFQPGFQAVWNDSKKCYLPEKTAGNPKTIETSKYIPQAGVDCPDFQKVDNDNRELFNKKSLDEYNLRQIKENKQDYHLKTGRDEKLNRKIKYPESKKIIKNVKIKKRKISKQSSDHRLSKVGSITYNVSEGKNTNAVREKERRKKISDLYANIKALLELDCKMCRCEVLSKSIQYIKERRRGDSFLPEGLKSESINERKGTHVCDIGFNDNKMTGNEEYNVSSRIDRQFMAKRQRELGACLGIPDKEKVTKCELLGRLINWIKQHPLEMNSKYSFSDDSEQLMDIREDPPNTDNPMGFSMVEMAAPSTDMIHDPSFHNRTFDLLAADSDTLHLNLSSRLNHLVDNL